MLMASAPDGQKRPRLAESADVFWSALKMRLRGPGPASENRPWADALALFSLVAPLFLLLVDILNVALPYRLRPGHPDPVLPAGPRPPPRDRRPPPAEPAYFHANGRRRGGHRGPGAPGAAVGGAGRAGGDGRVLGRRQPVDSLDSVSAAAGHDGVFIVQAAALVASPGPRRGRQLVNWRVAVVLVVAAAAVHVLTFRYDMSTVPRALAGPAAVGGHVLPGRQRRAGGGRGGPGGGLETEPLLPAAPRSHVLALRDPAGLRLDRGHH